MAAPISGENGVSRKLFLTGHPGVGKTTLLRSLYEHYTKRGVMISGILTEEAKEGNERIGFKIRNLMSGQEGWLASKTAGQGPKIGSYTVNTSELENVGATSLLNAVHGDASFVIVDEVGPMEMTSSLFRHALSEVLTSRKTTVASVKYNSHYVEVENASKMPGTRMIIMSRENRDRLLPELTAIIDVGIAR